MSKQPSSRAIKKASGSIRLTFLKKTALAFALCSLHPCSYGGPYAEAVDRAATWLEQQHDISDGSWPGYSHTATFVQTSEAVSALQKVNRRYAAYYAGLAWIKNHEADNNDSLARRLRLLSMSTGNAAVDTDSLNQSSQAVAAGQRGWGLSTRYTSSPLDTALALIAMREDADAVSSEAEAVGYLKASRLAVANDRGWPATSLGQASDPFVTAIVMMALATGAANDSGLPPILNEAASVLASKVSTSSPLHLRALAYLALNATGLQTPTAVALLSSIVAEQQPSGSFAADVYVTALAIQAIAAAEQMSSPANSLQITIADAALRNALNAALGRNSLDQIQLGELKRVTRLDAENLGISDISALQSAISLEYVDLRGNSIPVSQLSYLSNAKTLLINTSLYGFSGANDSDADGVSDQNETEVGTNYLNSASKPLFKRQAGWIQLNPPKPYIQGEGWNHVMEDFDGDGDLDVAIYFNGSNEHYVPYDCDEQCYINYFYDGPEYGYLVYFENLNGAYAERRLPATDEIISGDLRRFVVADFNNDGKKDILLIMDQAWTDSTDPAMVSPKAYRRIVLFLNETSPANATSANPNGVKFVDRTAVMGISGDSWMSQGIVFDTNSDGYPDIVSSGRLYRYDMATSKFTRLTGHGLPSCQSAEAADLDGDGVLDFVCDTGGTGFRFFKNNGNSSFTEWPNSSSVLPLIGRMLVHMLPADVNGDGRQDIVLFQTRITSDWQSFDGAAISFLINNGITSGAISVERMDLPELPPSGNPEHVFFSGSVADLNNDGMLDLIIFGRAGSSQVLLAKGNGEYQVLDHFAGLRPHADKSEERPATPSVVDLNSDGKVDLFSMGFGGYPYLFNTGAFGAGNHGISVELVGKLNTSGWSSGKDAFGARVEVSVGGKVQSQYVVPSMGRSRRLHFGLGPNATGVQLRIFWPGVATPQVVSGDSHVDSLMKVIQP
ncbi:FG-GAP-like repeat-containing protein [Methyloversatilis thermotolerans]|uniref:FG-GAP-like repeat-containing protein n=1 Tax=Methyloversatilis thermotolerans TaxID=1346290 RepID=UPI00039E2B7F|nr:FG-GAP-like repeat-containing protein [Methyloversatilis thermotolerans]